MGFNLYLPKFNIKSTGKGTRVHGRSTILYCLFEMLASHACRAAPFVGGKDLAHTLMVPLSSIVGYISL